MNRPQNIERLYIYCLYELVTSGNTRLCVLIENSSDRFDKRFLRTEFHHVTRLFLRMLFTREGIGNSMVVNAII